MIRLEGAQLPREAQGAIPPILFGDLLRDVPGIPVQVGWTAVLATNCGVGATDTTFLLGGADLAETLAAVPATGVVQLEQEWCAYTAVDATAPAHLTISARGYAGTTAAAHAKGTTVYFVETKPIYVFAYVPPGCTYPDDMLVQLRVNGNAETPPVTVRLQDERLVPGVRLVTAEFDASHAFLMPPETAVPSQVIGLGASMTPLTPPAGSMGGSAGSTSGTGPKLGQPAPPTIAAGGWFYTAPAASSQQITLRQGPLGTVTADLRGLCDTGAGRYSGVPAGPLVQPAAIVRLLLEETYRETDPTAYHTPTWTATATAHAAAGLTWRLIWTGEAFEAFRDAAQRCGQADLSLDDEGRWRYAFRAPRAPAVATLTTRELLEEPALEWTAGRDVITELEVAWGRGIQSGTVTLTSPFRIRHGRNHGGVTLPYVATEANARALGAYQLARRDHPRQRVTVRAAPLTLPLTLGDWIFLDTPLLARYGEQRVPFEILGITERGDQRVLACLEGDPLSLDLEGALGVMAQMAGTLTTPILPGLGGATALATAVVIGTLDTLVVLAGAGGATAIVVGQLGDLEGTLMARAQVVGTLT